MSKFNWWFKPQIRGMRDRNPALGAFFDAEEASQQVGSVVGALVREGLQNSGDARARSLPATEPVRIRIFVSGETHALPADDMAVWADGIWDHLAANDSGLRRAPKETEPCHFLVLEDFGTTGLVGDTSSDEASKEPFYCFFRAENTTSKGGNEGGSWGIGKTAFPRASRANILFALSARRTDERTVLMGSTTLRTHTVAGKKYTPDAWFGAPETPDCADAGGVIQPIEDLDILRQFASDFHLTRDIGGAIDLRAGTSIVVPWCDPEINESDLALAVIESNFIPIVRGSLEVSIGSDPDPALDTVLSAETIVDEVASRDNPELSASVSLAQWMLAAEEQAVELSVETASHSIKWEQYSLEEQQRDRLLQSFSDGDPIMVVAPVTMRRKGEGETDAAALRIALQRFDDKSVRPVFLRGSLVVPDRGIRRVPSGVAIIEAQDDRLGELLRAAEDPGHKEWSKSAENFEEFLDTYAYAGSFLAWARASANQVFRLLYAADSEVDLELLGDVFAVPLDADGGRKGGRDSGDDESSDEMPDVESSPQPVVLARIKRGFRVAAGGNGAATPAKITVRVAFDTGRGDPFARWAPEDFDFSDGTIKLVAVGASLAANGNTIILEPYEKQVELRAVGFDPGRGDLILSVDSEGEINA